MVAELKIDASDLDELARAFGNLPGQIKGKAMARSMRRMRSMARTKVVRRNAEHAKIKQKLVRERTTASFNSGSGTIEIVEKSGWIPLYKLGRVRQTRRGVTVPGRGRYDHAFIATMKSGHTGVFLRVPETQMPSDPAKEQIRELFGPNPAHVITNNPEEYMKALAEVIDEHLAPRFMHELDRVLPR